MTIAAEPTVESIDVKPHRFTPDEYLEMAERGYFDGNRVELIDGEILDMSPQQLPHRRAVTRCFRLATHAYNDPSRFFVVSQGTLRLNGDMPEPDLYVLPCGEQTPESQYPLPLWILEIAESTYRHDSGRKLSMYARHGVAEYLILDLARRQLVVHQQPIQNASRWSYRLQVTLTEHEVFRPLNGPVVEWPVMSMLP